MPIFRKSPQFESGAEIPEEEILDLTKEAEIIEEGEDAQSVELRQEIERATAEHYRRMLEPASARFFRRAEKKLRALLAGLVIFTGWNAYHSYQKKKADTYATIAEINKIRGQVEEIKPLYLDLQLELGDEFTKLLQIKEETFKDTLKVKSQPREVGEVREEERVEVKVDGFERVDVENKIVREVFLQTFPREWHRDTGKIFYQAKALPKLTSYGSNVGNPIAVCADAEGNSPADITFGKQPAFNPEEELSATLGHELAHTIDPLRKNDLPIEERLLFMRRLVDRVKSPDRHISSYVESISNPDKKNELLYKATEYWAEIWEMYLSRPEYAIANLLQADLDLIEDYLKVIAPKFDAWEAAQKRQKLLESIFNDKQRYKAAWAALETITPRDLLAETSGFLDDARKSAEMTFIQEEARERIDDLKEQIEKKLFGVKDVASVYEKWLWKWYFMEDVREMMLDASGKKQFEVWLEEAARQIKKAQDLLQEEIENASRSEELKNLFGELDNLMFKNSDMRLGSILEGELKRVGADGEARGVYLE